MAREASVVRNAFHILKPDIGADGIIPCYKQELDFEENGDKFLLDLTSPT